MRAPASLLAVPLLAGAAAGLSLFAAEHVPLAAAAGAGLALAGGAAAWLVHDADQCVWSIVLGAALAGASCGAGAARAAYSPPLLRWFHAHRPAAVLLEGTLAEDAAPGPTGASMVLRVSRAGLSGADGGSPVHGGVRLTVAGVLAAGRLDEWRAGRTVRVSAYLREPSVYLNPGVPDERPALARRGIALVGSVKSAALVETVAGGTALGEAAGACRRWTRDQLSRVVGRWSRRSSGIATAILIGDRTGLDREDERRLQEAGTYHVIAISGGNIAILAGMLLLLLRAAGVPPRAASGLSILLLLLYALVVAPSPSVQRAVAAAVIYLSARIIDHRGPPLNVLATAAVLALAVFPLTVFDPAFILSFGATAGILTMVPRLARVWPAPSALLRAAGGLLAATVAAEVVLAPVGATFFSRFTLAGLILNFAAVPLMSAVQAGSLLALLFAGWGQAPAFAIGYLVHLAASGLVDSAALVDYAPWLSRAVPPPALWLVVSYYAAVAVALSPLPMARYARGVAPLLLLPMFGGWAATSRDGVPPPPHGLRVAFLDVGQGDATLLVLPGGRSLLVDAGGFPIPALQDQDAGAPGGFDVGERVVAPALRALGVRRLDALVVTHGDPDHIGGAPAVLRSFRPRAVWEGVPVPPHRDLAALARAADELGAERRTVVAGDRLQLGRISIRVLHPALPDWERQRVRNEDSIVLEVQFGEISIVLPGDIGGEGERAILAFQPSSPTVILKAPHHGSATSSTPALLSALRPAAVVFSAGRANRFGHPHPSVVARYAAAGSEMFSTAVDGAVILDTDGRSVEMCGWTGRRLVLRSPRAEPRANGSLGSLDRRPGCFQLLRRRPMD